MKKDKSDSTENTAVDFNQAAILTDDGEEIAITETMVRKAIKALDSEAYTEED